MRLRTEEEVVANHWPHARQVPSHKEHLLVVSTEDLVTDVHEAGRDIDPHEGEVPLQRTSQPSAKRKSLGPVEKIFLRDLRPEARKSAKDLESAADHHEERDRVQPVAQAHYK